jgi:hypothetical protein
MWTDYYFVSYFVTSRLIAAMNTINDIADKLAVIAP